MITHVVLFRPRADLTDAQRRALAESLTAALSAIPSIRRIRVGRRVRSGRPYEALMRTDYPYAAFIEFDDAAGMQAYFEHPTHEVLAQRFFESFEDALMYDYHLDEGQGAIAALL